MTTVRQDNIGSPAAKPSATPGEVLSFSRTRRRIR
jgi:hypothetical protein